MNAIVKVLRNVGSVAAWILTGGNIFKKRKEVIFPSGDNHSSFESGLYSRREIIKNLAVVPVFGFLFWDMARKHTGRNSFEEDQLSIKKGDSSEGASVTIREKKVNDLQGNMPKGNIKELEISRMIIGGNLISGYAHSRDLVYVSDLVKEYHTDEKVIDTLFLCEECGINTAILRTDTDTVRVLDKYRKMGGKIQWIAQYYPAHDNMDNVNLAIDNGAAAAFSQGARADSFVSNKRVDVLHKSLEYIRSQGIPSGIGAHMLEVPVTCEKEGLDPDFYMKTLHHYEFWSAPSKEDRSTIRLNNWSPETEETIDYMETLDKPWIAFKILAAGAIRAQEGLRYAFENGADFACIGMFDFQVVENSKIISSLFQGDIPRNRPWRG